MTEQNINQEMGGETQKGRAGQLLDQWRENDSHAEPDDWNFYGVYRLGWGGQHAENPLQGVDAEVAEWLDTVSEEYTELRSGMDQDRSFLWNRLGDALTTEDEEEKKRIWSEIESAVKEHEFPETADEALALLEEVYRARGGVLEEEQTEEKPTTTIVTGGEENASRSKVDDWIEVPLAPVSEVKAAEISSSKETIKPEKVKEKIEEWRAVDRDLASLRRRASKGPGMENQKLRIAIRDAEYVMKRSNRFTEFRWDDRTESSPEDVVNARSRICEAMVVNYKELTAERGISSVYKESTMQEQVALRNMLAELQGKGFGAVSWEDDIDTLAKNYVLWAGGDEKALVDVFYYESRLANGRDAEGRNFWEAHENKSHYRMQVVEDAAAKQLGVDVSEVRGKIDPKLVAEEKRPVSVGDGEGGDKKPPVKYQVKQGDGDDESRRKAEEAEKKAKDKAAEDARAEAERKAREKAAKVEVEKKAREKREKYDEGRKRDVVMMEILDERGKIVSGEDKVKIKEAVKAANPDVDFEDVGAVARLYARTMVEYNRAIQEPNDRRDLNAVAAWESQMWYLREQMKEKSGALEGVDLQLTVMEEVEYYSNLNLTEQDDLDHLVRVARLSKYDENMIEDLERVEMGEKEVKREKVEEEVLSVKEQYARVVGENWKVLAAFEEIGRNDSQLFLLTDDPARERIRKGRSALYQKLSRLHPGMQVDASVLDNVYGELRKDIAWDQESNRAEMLGLADKETKEMEMRVKQEVNMWHGNVSHEAHQHHFEVAFKQKVGIDVWDKAITELVNKYKDQDTASLLLVTMNVLQGMENSMGLGKAQNADKTWPEVRNQLAVIMHANVMDKVMLKHTFEALPVAERPATMAEAIEEEINIIQEISGLDHTKGQDTKKLVKLEERMNGLRAWRSESGMAQVDYVGEVDNHLANRYGKEILTSKDGVSAKKAFEAAKANVDVYSDEQLADIVKRAVEIARESDGVLKSFETWEDEGGSENWDKLNKNSRELEELHDQIREAEQDGDINSENMKRWARQLGYYSLGAVGVSALAGVGIFAYMKWHMARAILKGMKDGTAGA